MSRYIDAEKLIAEIKRREGYISVSHFAEKLLSIITSLQQEQGAVELEKEIEEWFDNMGDAWDNREWSTNDIKSTARHFYELGFNTRK